MKTERPLQSLSDDDLLRRLAELLRQSRGTEADLVAHIAEVDERRLYAREACPSMFAYCTEVLRLSEPEAFLRIAVARASRQHPVLLSMLADGRLHLTGIALLSRHLTPENRDAVLARATHKSKRQIEELVAELSPQPDVPDVVWKLPELRRGGVAAAPAPKGATGLEHLRRDHDGPRGATALGDGELLRPDGVASPPVANAAASIELRPERVSCVGRPPGRSSSLAPIAPGRYKVQFAASTELRDKLERLQTLMRTAASETGLADVIEAAVTEKLQRLEARRLARTPKPRKTLTETDTTPRSRYLPAAVRRAVRERDQNRCRYADKDGRRCTARHRLEFHHRHPFGVGGDHAVDNVSLMCRTHNRYLAEIDYGKSQVRTRTARQPKPPVESADSTPGPVAGLVRVTGGPGRPLAAGPRLPIGRPQPRPGSP